MITKDLDHELRVYVATARAAWPALEVDEAQFVRYVEARALLSGAHPPITHAGDVYLACACAGGVPGAVEAFHGAYRGVIARVLSRRGASSDMADDATQMIHERLLTAMPGTLPKIAEYTGTGPLRSWVSTTAATTVSMMRRAGGRRREEPADEHGAAMGLVAVGPDLAYMKERYKAELEEAIVIALGELGARERAILRLHLGERLSVDRIGALYSIDRSTAARWLTAARDALVNGARAVARSRLKLSSTECDSIAALVQSDLDVSVARLLGSG